MKPINLCREIITMETIIKILKSIKFWTIIGVIASLIGLYYTFVDIGEIKALSLSVGNISIKNNRELLVVNVISGWEPGAPLLMTMPFGLSNTSNKTIENIALNYIASESELAKCSVVSHSVSPSKVLAPLYIKDSVSFERFEIGGGIYTPRITPKTAVGANDVGGVYMPMICPKYENNYFISELPTFTLLLSGDNCKKESYTVHMVVVYISSEWVDYSQAVNDILRKYTNKFCTALFVVHDGIDKNLYEIEGIPFFKLDVNQEIIPVYQK